MSPSNEIIAFTNADGHDFGFSFDKNNCKLIFWSFDENMDKDAVMPLNKEQFDSLYMYLYKVRLQYELKDCEDGCN